MTNISTVSALRVILNRGGLPDTDLHCGRRRPGTLHRATVRSLEARGLVEYVREKRITRGGNNALFGFWYATAAGCRFVHEEKRLRGNL